MIDVRSEHFPNRRDLCCSPSPQAAHCSDEKKEFLKNISWCEIPDWMFCTDQFWQSITSSAPDLSFPRIKRMQGSVWLLMKVSWLNNVLPCEKAYKGRPMQCHNEQKTKTFFWQWDFARRPSWWWLMVFIFIFVMMMMMRSVRSHEWLGYCVRARNATNRETLAFFKKW